MVRQSKNRDQRILMRINNDKVDKRSSEYKFVSILIVVVVVVAFARTTAEEFYVRGKDEAGKTQQVPVEEASEREVVHRESNQH